MTKRSLAAPFCLFENDVQGIIDCFWGEGEDLFCLVKFGLHAVDDELCGGAFMVYSKRGKRDAATLDG